MYLVYSSGLQLKFLDPFTDMVVQIKITAKFGFGFTF